MGAVFFCRQSLARQSSLVFLETTILIPQDGSSDSSGIPVAWYFPLHPFFFASDAAWCVKMLHRFFYLRRLASALFRRLLSACFHVGFKFKLCGAPSVKGGPL